MEINELTDEQIATLTPEQVELLESNPEKLDEILGAQKKDQADSDDKPEPEVKEGVAHDAGIDADPVVLNKSGKGTIPYEKHKELRVEVSTLRDQLQTAQTATAEATKKLDELLATKAEATTTKAKDAAESAIQAHMDVIETDMPELHQVLTAKDAKFQKELDAFRKQNDELAKTLAEMKAEREETKRVTQQSIEEQVAEAKDNNPDLTHWEANDPEAWDEALKQDEILRTSSKWGKKPYAERFDEVVRRVRAIMPEASETKKSANPEKTKADAKAKVETAPARKLTTLSDVSGGASPASEAENLANLSTLELTKKLMTTPDHVARASRAEIN